MKNTKVALCTETIYPLYGVEKRVYEMAKRLPKYGFDVDVFTSTAKEKLPDINIIQVSAPTIINPPKRNYAFCLSYLFNLYRKIVKENKIKKYDIVDANGHLSLIPCYLAAKQIKKPVIATIHDLYLLEWYDMYSGKAAIFGLPFEIASAKLPYDRILTLNSSLKRKMIKILGIPENKVEVLQSGIDVRYLDKIKSKKKEKTILYVGRLVPQKSVDTLIKAYSLLPNEIKEDYKLKIVGEGNQKEYLERLAKKLNIKNIVFTGKIERHEDVVKEIKKASVFVLPSQRESFGITVLEAMASGTPVVSTATEGPSDYIKNGENGFLAEIGSPESIAGSIEKAISAGKRIVINARKTAIQYDWDKIVKRIAREYEKLM